MLTIVFGNGGDRFEFQCVMPKSFLKLLEFNVGSFMAGRADEDRWINPDSQRAHAGADRRHR